MLPPRALPQAKLGATNVIVFMLMTTKQTHERFHRTRARPAQHSVLRRHAGDHYVRGPSMYFASCAVDAGRTGPLGGADGTGVLGVCRSVRAFRDSRRMAG